jgi:DNA invertase Pin-like site-specific DNA recombinase
MATAIYVRVSTREQTEASQVPDLERWAKAQDSEVEWHRDTFTGKTMDRKGWGKLWEGILACRIDRVVVWRLDRLGRTASGLTTLFDDLLLRGVTLVSLREGFDLTKPAGRMLAGVLASVAQYERELTAERQLAGISAAKARGVRFGRPKGEGQGTGKRIKVTDEQLAMVKRLRDEGMKKAAIGRATGLHRNTVHTLLGQDQAAPGLA